MKRLLPALLLAPTFALAQISGPFVTRLTGTPPVTLINNGSATQYLDATGNYSVPSGTAVGSVTSVGVANANGLTGSVSNPSTTPLITLGTGLSGLVKANGAAFLAAVAGTDYLAPPSGTALLKANSGSALANAVSGADYSAGTSALATGIVKSTTGTGALSIAAAGDFPTLNQNTTGTASNVTGTVSPANGGTGVMNNVASTLTISGNFGTTLTVSGATALALPTSGVVTAQGNSTTGSGSIVLSSSPTLVSPALGTPASGVATNLTGTASGLTAGTVTTNANLTGPITSVGNATSVAAQTGTGSTFVMQTSPTLTTPTIGAATATSVNKVTVTAPITSATLTLTDGSTLATSGANSVTLTSTASTNVTLPTSGTLAVTTQAVDTFGATTDVTTNNVSSTKHGFAPKAPNDATKYLDGTGAYSVPTGSGALTLLQTQSASGAATVDFTANIDSTYSEYELHIISATCDTSGQNLVMRISTDGGSTWKSGSTDYEWSAADLTLASFTINAAGSTGASGMRLNVGTPDNTVSNGGWNGVIKFFDPSGSNKFKTNFLGSYYNSATVSGVAPVFGSGLYATAGAINGIRVMCGSGNISGVAFKLYGVKK